MFGVLDGHGENGKAVAKLVKQLVIEEISNIDKATLEAKPEVSLKKLFEVVVLSTVQVQEGAAEKVDAVIGKA